MRDTNLRGPCEAADYTLALAALGEPTPRGATTPL
jgi:hypothetical protein